MGGVYGLGMGKIMKEASRHRRRTPHPNEWEMEGRVLVVGGTGGRKVVRVSAAAAFTTGSSIAAAAET
jgi:hypothetical protein